VRHNLEGLSAVFPPGYLLSFVTDDDTEPIHDAPDMSLYMRSRMPGVLGLCFRSADFSEGDAATVSHEIAIYKAIRDTLGAATAALLTAQAQEDNGPPWDVLQATAAASGQAVVCAYQSDDSVDTINVKPIDLDSGTTYAVQSVDTGLLGVATGADLMANGVDIVQSPNTAAHILIINPQD
jgi:hypothetical protein